MPKDDAMALEPGFATLLPEVGYLLSQFLTENFWERPPWSRFSVSFS